jgi:hypothetical protein
LTTIYLYKLAGLRGSEFSAAVRGIGVEAKKNSRKRKKTRYTCRRHPDRR